MLGIKIVHNRKLLIRLNYYPLIQKVKTQLNIWSQRNISLYGKITVIKTFALSQLVYILSVLPSPDSISSKKSDPNECDFFNVIERILYEFIWGGAKKDKIKRSTLLKSYEEGGLKMTHTKSQNHAF